MNTGCCTAKQLSCVLCLQVWSSVALTSSFSVFAELETLSLVSSMEGNVCRPTLNLFRYFFVLVCIKYVIKIANSALLHKLVSDPFI